MKTIQANSPLLELLVEWNKLSFSKTILGSCTSEQLEFFVDSIHSYSSKLHSRLSKILQEDPRGSLAYLGHCANDEFTNLPEVAFQIETIRYKKYRLYFFNNQDDNNEEHLKSRIEQIVQIIQSF